MAKGGDFEVLEVAGVAAITEIAEIADVLEAAKKNCGKLHSKWRRSSGSYTKNHRHDLEYSFLKVKTVQPSKMNRVKARKRNTKKYLRPNTGKKRLKRSTHFTDDDGCVLTPNTNRTSLRDAFFPSRRWFLPVHPRVSDLRRESEVRLPAGIGPVTCSNRDTGIRLCNLVFSQKMTIWVS